LKHLKREIPIKFFKAEGFARLSFYQKRQALVVTEQSRVFD
jgi:hypothetical protein